MKEAGKLSRTPNPINMAISSLVLDRCKKFAAMDDLVEASLKTTSVDVGTEPVRYGIRVKTTGFEIHVVRGMMKNALRN